MISFASFQKQALSFPSVSEQPHFEKTSFRTANKIFATYDAKENRACLRLPEAEQNVFCMADTSGIYPAQKSWGRQGWTFFELKKVKRELIGEALFIAYTHVAAGKKKRNRAS